MGPSSLVDDALLNMGSYMISKTKLRIWGDVILQGVQTLRDWGMSSREQLVAICTCVLDGEFESYEPGNTCECCFGCRESRLLFRPDGTGMYWQAFIDSYEDDVDFTTESGWGFHYFPGSLQEGLSGLERCIEFVWDGDAHRQAHNADLLWVQQNRQRPCFHTAALILHPSDVTRYRVRVGQAVFVDVRRMDRRGRDFRDAMADLRILRAGLLPEPEELSTDPWVDATPPWLHLLDDLSLCTHRNQAGHNEIDSSLACSSRSASSAFHM